MAEQQNSSFFQKLTKLFSTQAIVVIDKDGKRTVKDTDDRQQGSTNLLNLKDRYTKLQRSFAGQQSAAQSMAYHQVRRELFRDYDSMDNDPIISSALDIYADESTLKNEFGDVIQIKTQNENVKALLENLFYDILNVEFNLWAWTRNMVKYGDFYLSIEVAPGKGIINVQPLPVYETERVENTDPNNPNYVKFKVNHDPNGKGDYENFEIAHFRLLSDTNFLPYGKAMIENGRRIWKQVSLMEDAMLIHRIMRAPDKRVFKIDIGNIPPQEVDNYMQKIINKMKKTPFVDKNTGDYNLKYNIQNLTEDFFLPVRGGDSGTEIDSLGGLQYTAIEDIDYLKNKLFAALKIPKAYLGYDENVNGKATLAAEDVRFARTIERIQRTLVSELTKLAVVHLAAQGLEGTEMVDFELNLVNPSTIYEQEKVNLWSEKVRLVSDITQLNMISKEWAYENIFNMSKDEADHQKTQMVNDLKDRFRYRSIEDEGSDPAMETEATDVESELEELKNELKDKGGRPKEGNTYGKDKHPYGRDPLGAKENQKALKKTESKIGREARKVGKFAKEYVNGISPQKKVITEKTDFLSDSNLLDEEKFNK
jgi:hypothetical protein|tara:strand:- start:131 stop:1912 length:1782 start_codon:yes stop_codon:yes gene_type:complete